MAAKRTIRQQQLDDLMECSICADVYKEPRTLPCLHSFCLVCCEGFCREKHPGDQVECPLCRDEFTIPPNGVNGLRKNFILEKLKLINQSPTGPQIDLSLIAIKTAVPSFCDKHTNKTLDWYCFACKEAICSSCLIQNHKSHDHQNLDVVTNELQVKLNAGVTDLQKVYEKCKLSLTGIEKEEGEFMRHIDKLETEINEDSNRLHEIIEQSKSALLSEVSVKKRDRLKEIDNVKQEVYQHMAFVSSLMNYTIELLKNGAAGDVARDANSLEKRIGKLSQRDEYTTSIKELGIFTLAYTSREAELTGLSNKLVGSISPVKVQAVRSLSEGNVIGGLTVLNKELYVYHAYQDIAVYDTDMYNERRRLKVPGLGGVNDLTSCQRYQCVYISDWRNNVIHKVRVKRTGSRDEYTQWAVDDQPSSLSVNSDFNIVVTCDKVSKFKVFTTDGKLVKVIQLQLANIFLPNHTIQLSADKYVVCHGGKFGKVSDPLYRVCIVDGCGRVKQSFDGSEGSVDKQLDIPFRLAVVKGMILVLDVNNRRVVMLSPTLRYVRTIVSIPIDRPIRMCFDEQTSQLYVVQTKEKNGESISGHVDVYSVSG